MALEIEKKFKVNAQAFHEWLNVEPPEGITRRSVEIHQGYWSVDPDRTVRIRLQGEPEEKGEGKGNAWLTLKGRSQEGGLVRQELEYAIDWEDGLQMWKVAKYPVSKTRWIVQKEKSERAWEVDVFRGALEGLVLAEYEMKSRDELLEWSPEWLEEEVTHDPQWSNAQLGQKAQALSFAKVKR